MRSLIILEVEHGETTDDIETFINDSLRYPPGGMTVTDYKVRVDLPSCFVLDSR